MSAGLLCNEADYADVFVFNLFHQTVFNYTASSVNRRNNLCNESHIIWVASFKQPLLMTDFYIL